jgi:hypothetical protein
MTSISRAIIKTASGDVIDHDSPSHISRATTYCSLPMVCKEPFILLTRQSWPSDILLSPTADFRSMLRDALLPSGLISWTSGYNKIKVVSLSMRSMSPRGLLEQDMSALMSSPSWAQGRFCDYRTESAIRLRNSLSTSRAPGNRATYNEVLHLIQPS